MSKIKSCQFKLWSRAGRGSKDNDSGTGACLVAQSKCSTKVGQRNRFPFLLLPGFLSFSHSSQGIWRGEHAAQSSKHNCVARAPEFWSSLCWGMIICSKPSSPLLRTHPDWLPLLPEAHKLSPKKGQTSSAQVSLCLKAKTSLISGYHVKDLFNSLPLWLPCFKDIIFCMLIAVTRIIYFS